MSYEVIFTPDADEDYARIDDPLFKSHVLDQIDRLAADPHRLGRPGSFPHLAANTFGFWGRDGKTYVTVLFEIHGQRLFVLGIGRVGG